MKTGSETYIVRSSCEELYKKYGYELKKMMNNIDGKIYKSQQRRTSDESIGNL